MRDLRGKKCLVTGAASGIGRATAQALAEAGAQLVLTDVDAAGLERAADELGPLAWRALDIADFEAVKAFAADVHARHGSLDMLLNIAGISIWGTVQALEHRHWRSCIEINLMGPIHVIESFLPAMIEAGRGGHLVNVSSAAGLFGLPWHAAYSASKFGLRGISEVLRFDLRRYGIDVSLVCPGAVDTPLVRSVQVLGVSDNGALARNRERFQKHAVTPEVAAQAIVRGIQRNKYLIFTSRDIQLGYLLQRRFAPLYELGMRLLNDRLHALGARS
ncbi:MAG: SDR family oxidoreductase [Polyangiales bacterium]